MAFTGKLLMDHQNAGIILGPPPDNAIRVENNETLIRRNLVDFLPVLKGGDSLNHAVSWFKGGSH